MKKYYAGFDTLMEKSGVLPNYRPVYLATEVDAQMRQAADNAITMGREIARLIKQVNDLQNAAIASPLVVDEVDINNPPPKVTVTEIDVAVQKYRLALKFIYDLAQEEYEVARFHVAMELVLRHIIRKCEEVSNG